MAMAEPHAYINTGAGGGDKVNPFAPNGFA